MTATVLTTSRLTLRGWRDDDRPAFHALNADPLVMATIGPVMTRGQSDAFMNRIADHFVRHGYGLWCVEHDGAAIGYTGFMVPWFRDGVEIGWRIRSGYWGRGIAPEAARECLRHGFEDIGFDEIVSFTAVTNSNSRRVMDKVGLVRDPAGDFDHPSVPDGSDLQPHVLYRLTRERWRASGHAPPTASTVARRDEIGDAAARAESEPPRRT